MTTHTTRDSNPLLFAPLFRWILLAVFLCGYGLVFVYVKNQQHQLGRTIRSVEKQIVETRTLNEVLLARITALSSRAELQRKLQSGAIALVPIQDHCIARLLPPGSDDGSTFARTASADMITR
jgi:apolipoprotein N-acyltransferase